MGLYCSHASIKYRLEWVLGRYWWVLYFESNEYVFKRMLFVRPFHKKWHKLFTLIFNAHDNNVGLLLIFNDVGHQFMKLYGFLNPLIKIQVWWWSIHVCLKKQIDNGIFDLLFTKVKNICKLRFNRVNQQCTINFTLSVTKFGPKWQQ